GCGWAVAARDATGGTAVGFTTGRAPGGVGSNRTRRRAGAPFELCDMKVRMRSSVSVVMRPPFRRRLASLPSLTARRPKVDSASPRVRQNSLISWRICSFMAALPGRVSEAVDVAREPTRAAAVNKKAVVGEDGQSGWATVPTGGLPVIFNTSGEGLNIPNNLKPRLLGNCPSLGLRSWAVVGTPAQPETADQCEKTQLKSDIEENGFTLALDSDVESVDPQVAPQLLVGNESPAPVRRYQRQDGIALVGRLIGKIKAGVDLPEHPAREDAEHDMRRLQFAIRARYRARFDRVKAESAVFIGCRATKSHKFRVRSRAAVARM